MSGKQQVIPVNELWMGAALDWARRGKGWTSPRPSVGCVLVRDGHLLAGGHTEPGDGRPHAEVVALTKAQQQDPENGARGATAYVTLEPCSHWGTTPPCCDALIQAGIKRAVVGITDPNPLVAGRGLDRMSAAGIEVVHGVLAAECRRTHDDFLRHIVSARPFVTLKSAVSLDGKIALKSGESKWITGDLARQRSHRLRHEHDVVVTGIGTVLADDPQLSVRLEGKWKQPARLVLDSEARLPIDARLWDGATEVLVAVGSKAPASRIADLEKKGATVIPLPMKQGGLSLEALLEELYQRKLFSIMVEGGSQLTGAFLTSGLVDKAAFFVAPMFIGEGLPALGDFKIDTLTEAPRLKDVLVEQLGNDVLVTGYLTDL